MYIEPGKPGGHGKSNFLHKKTGKSVKWHFWGGKQRLKPVKWTFSLKNEKWENCVKFQLLSNFQQNFKIHKFFVTYFLLHKD